MKYTLILDTSKMYTVVVAFRKENDILFRKEVTSQTTRSQHVLCVLETLMKEKKIHWNDIDTINIATGPGSFTGLRVGATIGLTLSWLLSLVLNDNDPGTVPSLLYGEIKWKMKGLC